MTGTEALRHYGWEPEDVRELAQEVARTPEQARHLEQRVRQVAEAKARRMADGMRRVR